MTQLIEDWFDRLPLPPETDDANTTWLSIRFFNVVYTHTTPEDIWKNYADPPDLE